MLNKHLFNFYRKLIVFKYLKRIKSSKAFGLMDNCVADIREYRALISKTNKGMEDVEKKTFTQDYEK